MIGYLVLAALLGIVAFVALRNENPDIRRFAGVVFVVMVAGSVALTILDYLK